MASAGGGRGTLLLARSVTRHHWFDLSPVPQAERVNALRAQLLAWQPFPDSRYLIVLHADHAQVYALDNAAAADILAATRPSPRRWWPEPLLHAGLPDGVHLVHCLEGVDGQAWLGGVMRASRWWTEVPDLAEWQSFVRQSRVPGLMADSVPAVQNLPWQKPSGAIVRDDELGRLSTGVERALVGAVFLLLMVFSGMVARDVVESLQLRNSAQMERDALGQEMAPLLAVRDKALALAEESRALALALTSARPLDVLDELVQRLPGSSVVREFDLAAGGLRVALDLPAEASRVMVVADLEAGGWFTQVNEVRDSASRSALVLEMKLNGPMPPTRGNTDEGLQRKSNEALPKSLDRAAPGASAARAVPGKP